MVDDNVHRTYLDIEACQRCFEFDLELSGLFLRPVRVSTEITPSNTGYPKRRGEKRVKKGRGMRRVEG